MQSRQIVRATSFGPDALKLIFKAFDEAWSEIAPKMGSDPNAVEAARMTLASIVLAFASAGTITADGLRTVSVAAFCAKYRLEVNAPGCAYCLAISTEADQARKPLDRNVNRAATRRAARFASLNV
jgi:hypothetical protein